jgi:hypothetical protein
MKQIFKEIIHNYKEAFRALRALFNGNERYYNGMEVFVREAEENVKKKGTVDFSKEIESCRKILEKAKLGDE